MRSAGAHKPRVFMMDLWATVPYYTAYLSRALLQLGVPVQIGSITYYLDRECFRARGLHVQPGAINLVGRLTLPRLLRQLAKLAEGAANLGALSVRFRRRPPEVLHVQFLPLLRSRLPLDLWFVRFCRKRGSRLVLTVHDLLPHDTGQEHQALYQSLYTETDALICHSASIKERLIREFAVPPEKVSVIPHGPFFYDLAATTSPPEETSEGSASLGVLWQGILFPYKGVDLLLSAWKLVEEHHPGAQLLILGTGAPALLESVQQQARDLGLERVRFDLRFCSAEELVAAYQAATVVVYPYRAITTSGALATGLALGNAIVASDLPVFREVLRDDENALLADPRRPEQFANAILRVLTDPQLRSRLSHNVQKMEFGDKSWTTIAASTLQVYRAVLTSAAPSGRQT